MKRMLFAFHHFLDYLDYPMYYILLRFHMLP